MVTVTQFSNLRAPLPSEGCDSTVIRPSLGAASSLEIKMEKFQSRIAKAGEQNLTMKQESSADAERLRALIESLKDGLREQGTSITELIANVSELARQIIDLREHVKPSLEKLKAPLPDSTVVCYETREVRHGGD